MDQPSSVSAAMRTDTGLVRGHNEDFVSALEPTTASEVAANGWLYVVADGVGGADAGEVASRYATEQTLHHYVNAATQFEGAERLLFAMQAANTDLRKLAADSPARRRMATTMVAAAISAGKAIIANVGDSRAYLWREGAFEQITKDQSLVARLVEEGAITADEALTHPHKNVILYSIGSERRPPIDTYERDLLPGDLLVLCSDGLTRHVEDAEIGAIVGSMERAEAADDLVRLARDRGGEDNISVSIIQYGPRLGEIEPELTEMDLRTRPAMVAAASVTSAAVVEQRSLLPLTVLLTFVMVILIVLIWFVVQAGTAI